MVIDDLLKLFDPFLFNLLKLKKTNYQGLVSGKIGLALSCSYFYDLTKKDFYHECLHDLLTESIESCKHNCTFGYGLAGVAWMVELILHKKDIFQNADEWLEDVNKILKQNLYSYLADNNFDLFSGGNGIIFYFLTMKNHKKNEEVINDYIRYLSERINKGQWASDYSNTGKLDVINLGVPHGLTGILLILLLINENTCADVNCLIEKVADKIFSYCKTDSFYHFPSSIPENKGSKSFIGWCYGDLMTGYAFLKMSIKTNISKYRDLSLSILIDSTKRTDCHSHVLPLCHGLSANALIYKSVFQITGKEIFIEASKKWESLAIASFQAKSEEYFKEKSHIDFFENPSLFYGSPGFYIALLTLENMIDDNWSKCLLL